MGVGLLVEHGPGDGGDDQAAGDLDDGEGNPKETEECGAEQVDSDEEEDGVDSDAPGEGVVERDGRLADQREEDEGGTERVDERQKRAEGENEVVPEEEHLD